MEGKPCGDCYSMYFGGRQEMKTRKKRKPEEKKGEGFVNLLLV